MDDKKTTTLGEILSELNQFPKDLIVKSAALKLETTQGNRIDYIHPAITYRPGPTPRGDA